MGELMKVVEIVNKRVHREYWEYQTAEEAQKHFAQNIHFENAPDWVWEGYGFDASKTGDDRFIRPALSEGWVYNEDGLPWNPEYARTGEREQMHAETTNDTLQALRKIREGDTSIDWESWLKTLDDYNVAIEDTKNQKDYPLKVVYPEYPTKPTK